MKITKRISQVIFVSMLVSLLAPLAVLVPRASAATLTWDGEGADNNWSTAANWSGDVVPTDGDSIVFDQSILSGGEAILNNDLALNLAGISLTGTSEYGYLIQGNDLTVSGSLDSGSEGTLSLALNVLLGADTTAVGSGNIYMGSGGGSLDLSSFSLTLNMTNGHIASEGSLLGSGDLNINSGWFHTTNNAGTYSGDITVAGGALTLFDDSISDSSSVTATGGEIRFDSSTENIDYGMPFTLGTSTPSVSIMHTIGNLNDYPITLSGGVTLTSDVKFAIAKDVTIEAPFDDGGFDIIVAGGSKGAVRLPGGVIIEHLPTTTTIAESDKSSAAVVAYDEETVIVNGERGSAYIYEGGTLKGTGVITGSVNIAAGGILAPGLSPGCLGTGDLNLSGTFEVEIAGNTVCSEYDQAVVTGEVDLAPSGNAILDTVFLDGFVPALNDEFVIISNDASDAVVGTFEGLDDGERFEVEGGVTFEINYDGGDGNDVVLTAVAVPTTASAPDTGAGSIVTSPIFQLLALGLTSAVLIGFRKFNLSKN